jgi:hypothetical protein
VEPRKSNLKNLIVTVLLAFLVIAVAYESAKRGVFRRTREHPTSESAEISAVPADVAEPTPTPLPMHFPTVAEDDLGNSKRISAGLLEAFAACWPQAPVAPDVLPGTMTLSSVEKLFGKIKKREILGKSDSGHRVGLLFDSTVFREGAAGSATESDGTIQDFQARASGRMLHCDDADRCECLSAIGP